MALVTGWRRKVANPAMEIPAPPAAADRNPAAPATAADPTDRSGMDVIRAGDRRAFQMLIERHQAGVYGYLRSRLLQHADAEDLTQEVFLRSYIGRARFDGTIKVRAWLLGIARNVLREYVRKAKRRKEVAWTELCLELDELTACQEEQPYEDALVQLPTCVAGLGPTARQALEMHYRGKLRLAQIGEKMNRSTGAVKLLVFRARQALKRCLDSKRSHGSKRDC